MKESLQPPKVHPPYLSCKLPPSIASTTSCSPAPPQTWQPVSEFSVDSFVLLLFSRFEWRQRSFRDRLAPSFAAHAVKACRMSGYRKMMHDLRVWHAHPKCKRIGLGHLVLYFAALAIAFSPTFSPIVNFLRFWPSFTGMLRPAYCATRWCMISGRISLRVMIPTTCSRPSTTGKWRTPISLKRR